MHLFVDITRDPIITTRANIIVRRGDATGPLVGATFVDGQQAAVLLAALGK